MGERNYKAYQEGKNLFIPLTIEDFNLEMELLIYKASKISEDIIRKILADYN